MKNYKEFLAEDFVQDPYFRSWVLGELDLVDSFWENWLILNPEKNELIRQAKAMVIALQMDDQPLSSEVVDAGLERIFSQTTRRKVTPIYQQSWFRVAAMLLLVCGLGWGIFGVNRQNAKPDQGIVLSETKTADIKTIHLADGSVVTLEKGGKLTVDEDFGKKDRTVFLTGEAFFDIQRNPDKPFLVVSGSLVTRVLGTSFRISANPTDPEVSVSVRTGKVTVFRETAGNRYAMPAEHLVLTPNQKAVFTKSADKLVKTLVEKPVILDAKAPVEKFEFSETSIPDVFDQLEKAYGVEIIFDKQLLQNCNLNASLGDEPLFEKLDLICETIRAKYQIVDGQIILDAQGCK
ncbi:FecR family protein [Dyadobacter arcticus]|uniref:Ferric-dicitrate binding protein FerR (Iron transport regulator) n=1 Tax=Dyadobacter arcticus TaxID=1078754 RepID=A0ABX0US76_9BACT|nr:FecR family protein [Dyadobacter arcticus]NIJ54600.1 ferric-dicitrate binding protein FerR (iron transport regulator) [Dyadobacter arcticus]